MITLSYCNPKLVSAIKTKRIKPANEAYSPKFDYDKLVQQTRNYGNAPESRTRNFDESNL